MTEQRAWSLAGEPLALLRYVSPGEVARHVRLPGPSAESGARRLRAVYTALAEKTIGYAEPAPGAEAGMQLIRPPEQVLWAPRHATCLDLALVLAGACLTAGLHPVVVILDPPDDTDIGHALVLVHLDRDRRPREDGLFDDDVWHQPPAGLLDGLQPGLDGAGSVVAVDPVGFAVSLGATSTRGLDVDLDTALAHGAAHLTGGRWRLGVDVGSAWRDSHQPPAVLPVSEPLRAPYRAPETAESPLRLLRAEYALVGFQNRDELTVLRDWCRQTAAGDHTGLAVITGIGGSGKTRLALELAHRLRREGWYAGTLPKDAADGSWWLATVVSSVLVVLDYADGRVTDAIALLAALRARRGPPAVVVLTARTVDGDWLARIIESLDDDRHTYRREPIPLPDTHPDAADVYRHTVTKLATGPVAPPPIPRGIRWTTLDYVLLGWIAAQGATTLPTTPGELYDEVLRHEENYWSTVYSDNVREREPRRARLLTAAACLSLVAAPEHHANTVLTAVDDLREDARERHDVRDTLIACLRPAPGEGLALRPDPVGDHLVLREFGTDQDLLQRTVAASGDGGLERALVTLVRAGQHDRDRATRMVVALLDADIGRWQAVLEIAQTQRGAAAAALEQLASREKTPLPLEELSAALPFSPLGLYELALLVDRRRLDTARAAPVEPAALAELLERVSTRSGDAGDRDGALAAITEAVEHHQRLAQASPAAYLPDLAGSLNNLSRCRSETGDRDGALAAITEAVEHHQRLAQASPAAYLPDLAGSLNNLSRCRSETGDRDGALAAITEAVEIRRRLAQAPGRPGDFHPRAPTERNVTVSRHSALLT